MKHSKMWSEVVKQNRHPHGQFDEKNIRIQGSITLVGTKRVLFQNCRSFIQKQDKQIFKYL